jgi:hypothetical protein
MVIDNVVRERREVKEKKFKKNLYIEMQAKQAGSN